MTVLFRLEATLQLKPLWMLHCEIDIGAWISGSRHIYMQAPWFKFVEGTNCPKMRRMRPLKTRLHLLFLLSWTQNKRHEAKGENVVDSPPPLLEFHPNHSFIKSEHLFSIFLACHDVCHLYFSMVLCAVNRRTIVKNESTRVSGIWVQPLIILLIDSSVD